MRRPGWSAADWLLASCAGPAKEARPRTGLVRHRHFQMADRARRAVRNILENMRNLKIVCDIFLTYDYLQILPAESLEMCD